MDFTVVLSNIKQCEGQTFATSKGSAFSYEVCDQGLAIKRSEVVLPMCDIKAACKDFSLYCRKTGRGADAYINALLRDGRIRRSR